MVAEALKNDPDVRTAALASLNGHGDFMALLELPPDRWEIAVAVVTAQETERVRRSNELLNSLARIVRG